MIPNTKRCLCKDRMFQHYYFVIGINRDYIQQGNPSEILTSKLTKVAFNLLDTGPETLEQVSLLAFGPLFHFSPTLRSSEF